MEFFMVTFDFGNGNVTTAGQAYKSLAHARINAFALIRAMGYASLATNTLPSRIFAEFRRETTGERIFVDIRPAKHDGIRMGVEA